MLATVATARDAYVGRTECTSTSFCKEHIHPDSTCRTSLVSGAKAKASATTSASASASAGDGDGDNDGDNDNDNDGDGDGDGDSAGSDFSVSSSPSSGLCSNVFESGCLHTLLPDSTGTKRRVCHSEDTPETIAAGVCRQTNTDMDYPEVRLFSENWESAYLEVWVLQTLLSEILDVPTTVETGFADRSMDLYHPDRAYDGGSPRDTESLLYARDYGDCRDVPHIGDDGDYWYTPCAHVVTEIWNTDAAWKMASDDIIEAPQGLGVLGQEGWFVPKYTGRRDPSLLNYLGLQGEQNRRKVVEAFPRPTSWEVYCKEVSKDNCTTPDDVALRAPADEEDGNRYFIDDGNRTFAGFFRPTEDGDCDLHPTNCTGHIADYPCGWSSAAIQQAYHLGIPVDSKNGLGISTDHGISGYSYENLLEIWYAANHTKSNVILYWWYPDTLFDRFIGTDAEFTRISLPTPTQTCIEERVNSTARCGNIVEDKIGDPRGSCDDPPNPLLKVISTGLKDMIYHVDIPDAKRSPAYEAIQLFTITTLQLAEIFEYWRTYNDPREAVCYWMVDNQDWAKEFLPSTYPRTIQDKSNTTTSTLYYFALSIGSLAVLMVLGTSVGVYQCRKRRVMIYAQIEFLYLLLFGLFVVAVGALVNSFPVSDGTCVASMWLICIGYSIVLVPLLVKISAVNRLFVAAAGHRRAILPRNTLFKTVGGIVLCVAGFLVCWTVLDPPQKERFFSMSSSSSNNVQQPLQKKRSTGETIVTVAAFCHSSKSIWGFVAIGWNCIMLLAALVLAIQTRKIRLRDFNESMILGMIVYSQSVFVILRVILRTILSGEVSQETTLGLCESLIYSVDTMVTLMIYFLPKFHMKDRARSASSYFGLIRSSIMEIGKSNLGSNALNHMSGLASSSHHHHCKEQQQKKKKKKRTSMGGVSFDDDNGGDDGGMDSGEIITDNDGKSDEHSSSLVDEATHVHHHPQHPMDCPNCGFSIIERSSSPVLIGVQEMRPLTALEEPPIYVGDLEAAAAAVKATQHEKDTISTTSL